MTDLTTRLAAIGMELPEMDALADPRTARDIERLRANYNGVEQLQAALAAVVGELERVVGFTGACFDAGVDWKQRAEKAEKAQAASIEVLNDCQAEMGRQCARADKAEAELKDERTRTFELRGEVEEGNEAWRLCNQQREKAEAENARLLRLLDKPFLEKLAELEAENKLLVDHAAEHERLQKQAEAALVMRAIAKQEADHD